MSVWKTSEFTHSSPICIVLVIYNYLILFFLFPHRAEEIRRRHYEEKFVIDTLIFEKACARLEEAKAKVEFVRTNYTSKSRWKESAWANASAHLITVNCGHYFYLKNLEIILRRCALHKVGLGINVFKLKEKRVSSVFILIIMKSGWLCTCKGLLCIHVPEKEWKQSDFLHAKVFRRLYSSTGLEDDKLWSYFQFFF